MKEIIRTVTQEISTFAADDGAEFSNSAQCKAHEAKLSEEIKLVKWNKIFGKPISSCI